MSNELNLHKYQTEQQLDNTPHLKTMAYLTPPEPPKLGGNSMLPVMSASASCDLDEGNTNKNSKNIQMFVHQSAPIIHYNHGQINVIMPLPPGWIERLDTNGRVYYQNELTHEVQWKHPSQAQQIAFAAKPSVPSDMAPAPKPIIKDQDPDPDAYINESRFGCNCCQYCGYVQWCMWLGCIIFSIPFWFVMICTISDSFGLITFVYMGLDQKGSGFQVISTDEQCVKAMNFEWKIQSLYSNVTMETYELYFVLSDDEGKELYPVLNTAANQDELYQDPTFLCDYVVLPKVGECSKWIFNCDDYDIMYGVDELCSDYCPS